MKRTVIAIVLLIAGIAADQLTKLWALRTLADTDIPIIPTVSFRLLFNPGVAFGMAAGAGPILTVILLIVVAGLITWLIREIRMNASMPLIIVLSILIAGACGNLTDRILRAEDGPLSGHVVDFIAVEWFAVFNVADIFTTCGALLLAGLMFRRSSQIDRDKAAESASDAGTPDPS